MLHAHVAIAIAAVLSYLPLVRAYVPVADDWDFMARVREDGHGLGFLRGWVRDVGAWRSLGVLINAETVAVHPWFYGVYAIAAHIWATCMFFWCARVLLGSVRVAWVLAMLLAAVPFAFGAVVWAPAANIVLVTGAFFWLVAYLARVPVRPGAQWMALGAGAIVTLIAQLIQENLLFCYILAGGGAVALAMPARGGAGLVSGAVRTARERFCVLGPPVGAAVFVVLHLTVRGPEQFKEMSFNPRPVVSTWMHQYANLYVLEPLRHGFAWEVLGREVGAASIGLAVVLLVALAVVSGGAFGALKRESGSQRARPPSVLVLLFVLALMLAAGAIFMVAGGYSLDSRKRYPLVPLMLVGAGWCVVRSGASAAVHRLAAAGAVVAACVVGGAASWLNIALFRYEAGRSRALIEHLARERVTGPVKLRVEPDLTRTMPRVTSQWNGGMLVEDWMTNLGLDYHGAPHVSYSDDAGAPLIKYDDAAGRWTTDAPESDGR